MFMQDAADFDNDLWTCKEQNQILNTHVFLSLSNPTSY